MLSMIILKKFPPNSIVFGIPRMLFCASVMDSPILAILITSQYILFTLTTPISVFIAYSEADITVKTVCMCIVWIWCSKEQNDKKKRFYRKRRSVFDDEKMILRVTVFEKKYRLLYFQIGKKCTACYSVCIEIQRWTNNENIIHITQSLRELNVQSI